MAGAASKSGSSMPGGWGKEGDKKSTYSVEQDIQDHGENLVAGVIGKTGEVVDETGKTVGKVTEGEAGELVGNVVTATGDIIGKDGGVIGKALPLGELTENLTEGGESKEGGGFSIMGATKGVKGIVDTVDGTVQTVNRTLPLVGDLTKGIGLGEGQGGVLGGVLGGQSEKGKSQSGLLGSVLGGSQSEKGTQPGVLGSVLGGTQPLERDETVTDKDEKLTQVLSQKPEDPEDKISLTEDAKRSLFEDNEKTSEVAPVDLQDTTPQEQNAPSTIGDKQSDLAELEPEPVGDATEQADTIKDDISEKADSAKDFGTEQPTTARDFATEQGSDAGDAPSQANLTEEELRSRIPDDIATLDIPVSQIPEGLKSEIPDDLKTADIPVSQIPLDAQTQLPDDLVSQLPEELQSKLPTDAQTGDIPKSQLPTDAQTEDIPKSQLPTDVQTEDIPKSQLPSDLQTSELQTADLPESELEDLPSGYESQTQSGYIPKSEIKDDISTVLSTIRSAIPSDQRTVSVAGSKLLQPFEKFPGAEVNEDGKVVFDDVSIGRVLEGDPAELVGKTIDAEGNIINERGSIIGRAELKSEVAEELMKDSIDYSILKGAKVNKAGNLVNDKGEAIGRVVSGILKHLVGRKANEKGEIWNDSGKVIGKAEPIPETEREELSDPAPFEDFPGATVESNGHVLFNGEIVGRVIEGDPKKLKGKKVDDDGDILDRSGNTIGKAERWEPEPEAEPEPEPEVVIDRSVLAGKRVNKAGNVVDTNGTIFGRIIEGDVKRLVGRMCDKDGNVRSESGDIIGKAELVPEGEREGFKEGPFAELPGCTVNKEGHVVTPGGDIVGRLIQGDPKVLFGRAVDEDGDILDRNGNTLGKAERWEPEPEPEVEKKKGPMAGRKVNRKGEVVDEDGDIIGRLTTGELSICAGKEIDDDGDVVDGKGHTVGHCSLLEDIPEPEPEVEEEPQEDPAEVKAREEAEADRKLARSLGSVIEQGLDRMRPICKMITQKIEKAERTPKDDLDEEQLVKDVKPLIEEGGRILSELNGSVRALDPDGRIQRNAKHKSTTREASPEEHHLAEVLKELTGSVSETVEGAKRMIQDMPHAKKELNPLWGLLTEPLGQILAAVGLLLAGVLNLVGRLLSGLGLGGIVDGLLGTLGLNRLLEGLGLGSLTTALRGGKDKKK